MIRRGDIRWFRPKLPTKPRPVLVLGREEIIASLAEIPVMPITSQIRGLRWEIRLDQSDGMRAPCVLKPEWIRVVHRDTLRPWIAALEDVRRREVRAGLLDALGLDPVP